MCEWLNGKKDGWQLQSQDTNVKSFTDKSPIKTINDENKLCVRYSFTPQGVVPKKLFGVSNEEMDLS